MYGMSALPLWDMLLSKDAAARPLISCSHKCEWATSGPRQAPRATLGAQSPQGVEGAAPIAAPATHRRNAATPSFARVGKHRDDKAQPSKGSSAKDGGRHDVGRDGDTGKRDPGKEQK